MEKYLIGKNLNILDGGYKTTIQEQAIELINRNKGDIKDTLKIIDQMLLIYTMINSVDNYKQISFDLLVLKINLQIELIKYENNRKK